MIVGTKPTVISAVRALGFSLIEMPPDPAERDLTPDMLVIADAARPVALAGVMGGRDSEVSDATFNLLLESVGAH